MLLILKDLEVGIGVTGSFCTFATVIPHLKKLNEVGARLRIVFSEKAYNTSSRFGHRDEWRRRFGSLSPYDPVTDITGVEPIGPEGLLDVMVIAPCTGNPLAKMTHAITDTAVLMATKAHLRNERPVVVAISTNDGLSNNAANLGQLLNQKNIYFVPFGQDKPELKPNSLVAHMELLPKAVEAALEGEQLQPVLVEYRT